MPTIYEPLFADRSYGYRLGRSVKDALTKAEEYAGQGYTHEAVMDLSKYFGTPNCERLIRIFREEIKEERVVQMIKRYHMGGVLEMG